jgi:hypothetical protein
MSTPEPNPSSVPHNSQAQEPEYLERSESRIKARKLSCMQGKVADITCSGMRMLVIKGDLPEVGDVQSYTLSDGVDTIEIKGSVKWVRSGSLFARRSEVGVEFVKVDQPIRDAIVRLAVQGKLGYSSSEGPTACQIDVDIPNLYSMLGVVHCASPDEIKFAYRKECRRWHPDVNDSSEAAQRFDEISKAYSVLKVPELRARYDERYAERFNQAA